MVCITIDVLTHKTMCVALFPLIRARSFSLPSQVPPNTLIARVELFRRQHDITFASPIRFVMVAMAVGDAVDPGALIGDVLDLVAKETGPLRSAVHGKLFVNLLPSF